MAMSGASRVKTSQPIFRQSCFWAYHRCSDSARSGKFKRTAVHTHKKNYSDDARRQYLLSASPVGIIGPRGGIGGVSKYGIDYLI